MASMQVLQDRIDSFKPKRTTKKSSSSQKWPHSASFKAIPQSLAEAGFYFTPWSEDKDNVTCYMCKKQLNDWDKEDDPFNVHWEKCRDSCAWAAVRCGLEEDVDGEGNFIATDPKRLPTSKAMEKARLETFRAFESWPHDAVKGHGANSKKMAKAGFVYTPQSDGDDTASCLYCDISLSGWDPEDEPIEEHRKRASRNEKACLFFTASSSTATSTKDSQGPPMAASTTSKKPPSKAEKEKARSRSRGRPKTPHSEFEEEEADEEVNVGGKGKKSVASTASGAKTPASDSRLGSRAHHTETEDELDAEDDHDAESEVVLAPPSKSKSKRSAASSKTPRAAEDAEDDDDINPPARPKRSVASSVSKTPAPSSRSGTAKTPAPHSLSKSTAKTPASSSRRSTRSTKTPASRGGLATSDLEDGSEAPASQTKRLRSKKAKTVIQVIEEDVEPEEAVEEREELEKYVSGKNGKVVDEEGVVEEGEPDKGDDEMDIEAEEDEEMNKPKRGRKRQQMQMVAVEVPLLNAPAQKSKKKSAKTKPVEEDQDEDVEPAAPKPLKSKSKSKSKKPKHAEKAQLTEPEDVEEAEEPPKKSKNESKGKRSRKPSPSPPPSSSSEVPPVQRKIKPKKPLQTACSPESLTRNVDDGLQLPPPSDSDKESFVTAGDGVQSRSQSQPGVDQGPGALDEDGEIDVRDEGQLEAGGKKEKDMEHASDPIPTRIEDASTLEPFQPPQPSSSSVNDMPTSTPAPSTQHPPNVDMPSLTSPLTDSDRLLTVEQYIRKEIELEAERKRREMESMIRRFGEMGMEVRRRIEGLVVIG